MDLRKISPEQKQEIAKLEKTLQKKPLTNLDEPKSPLNQKDRPGPAKQVLPRNEKYVDNLVAKKCDANIIFEITKKGTGKTTQWVRDILIANEKDHNLPGGIVRTTKEQKESFAAELPAMLSALNFKMTSNHYITTNGLFYKATRGRGRASKVKVQVYPILRLFSLNEAMKIQSSSFPEMSFLVFDEVVDHFKSSSDLIIKKIINIISTILRDRTTKIIFLSNNVNYNDPLYNYFQITDLLNVTSLGKIKKKELILKDNNTNNNIALKIALWRPKETKQAISDRTKSLSYKVSLLTGAGDYGSVINSENFFIDRKDLLYIQKLGNFQNIININGFKIGYWIDKNGFWQFSSKYNKNGKTFFFSFIDYAVHAEIGNLDWIKSFKFRLIKNQCQFENNYIFEKMIDLIKYKYN